MLSSRRVRWGWIISSVFVLREQLFTFSQAALCVDFFPQAETILHGCLPACVCVCVLDGKYIFHPLEKTRGIKKATERIQFSWLCCAAHCVVRWWFREWTGRGLFESCVTYEQSICEWLFFKSKVHQAASNFNSQPTPTCSPISLWHGRKMLLVSWEVVHWLSARRCTERGWAVCA